MTQGLRLWVVRRVALVVLFALGATMIGVAAPPPVGATVDPPVFETKWGTFGAPLRSPRGVAVDGSGNVYVADTDNDRIQKFTSDGVLVTQWGTSGSGDGQFLGPHGVAVDGSGNVYVADYANRRVQKFTSAGVFVTKWGGTFQFGNPYGVAVDGSGNVYVTDSSNHRVQKFTSAGVFVTKWGTGGSGDGQFNQPLGVAVDGSGNVYVADYNNHRIQKFTSAGVFVTKWGTFGSGDGQFQYPLAVAVDGSGNVYVTDSDRIQKFTSAGVFVTKWGTSGSGDGQFQYPAGVAVDGSGNVYVADTENHRIQKFTSAGVFVTKWGTYGTGDGQFWYPEDVAVDASGNVYVTDTYNHRVQKFTSAGSPAGVSGTVTETGSGAPVAGAWVAVLRTSDFSIAAGAVADGSGNFTVPVAAGSYYLYVVDPTGAHTAGFHGPPTTVSVTSGAMTDVDPQMVSLRGSVAGTVTEAGSGTPIGGAWVIGINATTGATQQGVVADGAGQYNIGGLTPGSYRPVFVDPTGAHASRYFPNSVDFLGATSLAVTAGASTAANVALPTQSTTPGAQTLSGTVREAGTNAALGGVFVVALRAADFRNAGGAVTNGSGQYSLNVAAGDYKLAFVDSTGLHNMEWHDNQPNTGLATATSVTAPAVTNATLDANTGTLAGTVTDDPSGTPITGAWVVAIGPTGAIAGGAVTAPDGTYAIAGLAPGTYRATIVDPNGGRAQEYYNNSPDYAGATPVNITAANTTSINANLHHP